RVIATGVVERCAMRRAHPMLEGDRHVACAPVPVSDPPHPHFRSQEMSRRRMLTVTGSLLSIGAAFAACSSSASDTAKLAKSSRTFGEQGGAGEGLWGEQCSKCHGDTGQGTAKSPRLVGLKEGALPVDPPADRKFRKTRFVTVADVADFVVKNMPPN